MPFAQHTIPVPAESGVSLRSVLVLAVGIDDCSALEWELRMAEIDVRFVRVAEGIAACRMIEVAKPSLVVLGSSLWRDEVRGIREAARLVDARVIEPKSEVTCEWIANTLLGVARSA
jgi:hypothetical protein